MRFFLTLNLLFWLISSEAQKLSFIEQYTSEISGDNWGNLYAITPDNTLLKYDKKGELIGSFTPKIGHRIEHIDARNPFKIILKFEAENRLLILDNKLSPISSANISINAETKENFLFCSAPTGGIWTYFPENNCLIKWNDTYKKEYKFSTPELPENVIKIGANSSSVFFQNDKRGLYVLSLKIGNIRELENLKVCDFCVENESLFFFDPKDFCFKKQDLKQKNTQTLLALSKKKRVKNIIKSSSTLFYTEANRIYFYYLK